MTKALRRLGKDRVRPPIDGKERKLFPFSVHHPYHPPQAHPTMKLPTPHDQLGGCFWLPRLIAKARLLHAGKLPQDYARRFCAPTGVDGHFITFFSLTREDVLEAALLDDASILPWFQALPNVNPARIREWNQIAENLGRPGFPMEDRLPNAKTTTYAHVDTSQVATIFQMIELDEAQVVAA